MKSLLPFLALIFLCACSGKQHDLREAPVASHEWPAEGLRATIEFTPGGHLVRYEHDESKTLSDFAFRYIALDGNENDWVTLSPETADGVTGYETLFTRPKGTGLDIRYTEGGEQKTLERWTPDIKGPQPY